MEANHKQFETIKNDLIFEQEIDLFWEIPVREELLENMEMVEEYYGYRHLLTEPTEKEELRIKEIVSSQAVNSIFPAFPVEDNFFEISKYILITILISVIFMISPIFIKDYKNNLIALQYTSKTGRRLFRSKVAAGMLSAFMITTILVAVYYSIYSTNEVAMFLNSGINSFMGSIYWYDLTFQQLIMMTIILTYVLVLSFALLAIVVSNICKNYISLIVLQLPIFVTICILITRGYLLGEAFLIQNSQIYLYALYLLFVLIPLLLCLWRQKVEAKIDITY